MSDMDDLAVRDISRRIGAKDGPTQTYWFSVPSWTWVLFMKGQPAFPMDWRACTPPDVTASEAEELEAALAEHDEEVAG